MGVYAYLRVSTINQHLENQKASIINYAARQDKLVDQFIEETISGTKDWRKRALGPLVDGLKEGDILIVAELSRIERSMLGILTVLETLMNKDVQVWSVKEGFQLGKDIQSKVLAMSFSICATVERELLSMRTKEALARLKHQGVKLGRPKGSTGKSKLDDHEQVIREMISKGCSVASVQRMFDATYSTVINFMKNKGIELPTKSNN